MAPPSRPEPQDRAVPDRAAAEDGDDVIGTDLGEGRAVDARREHVPQEHAGVVIHLLRERQQVDVGVGDAQPLGLRPGQGAAEDPVAEDPVVVAECRLAVAAEPAVPAGDVERDRDAVTRANASDLVPHRLHDADRLVSERFTRLHRGLAVEQVEIAAADRRAGDADDRVAGFLELRIGDIGDADAADPVEDDRAHQPSSGKVVSTSPAMYASSCVPFV